MAHKSGHFYIDETCIGCGACDHACPGKVDAIYQVEDDFLGRYAIALDDCIDCGCPALPRRNFHRQLADLALELSDLALVLGDVHRLGKLVGELARLVLADPKPNQIARETMPMRELMQTRPAIEKFFGKLTLEL